MRQPDEHQEVDGMLKTWNAPDERTTKHNAPQAKNNKNKCA
jgi:hypothetical protein